jgi:hypothetical protein
MQKRSLAWPWLAAGEPSDQEEKGKVPYFGRRFLKKWICARREDMEVISFTNGLAFTYELAPRVLNNLQLVY